MIIIHNNYAPPDEVDMREPATEEPCIYCGDFYRKNEDIFPYRYKCGRIEDVCKYCFGEDTAKAEKCYYDY